MLSQSQREILNTQKNIQLLKKRESRYTYLGILDEYQAVIERDLYQRLDYTKLNPAQHFAFKRVLHGLNMYSKEEVNKMHWDKKRRIIKVWKRGQQVLNEWKQTISNKRVNAYLVKWFDKTSFLQAVLDVPVTDYLPEYDNKLSLKKMGIYYEDVILKFMSVGLLPKNFLELK